jgi:hypothetical protein
MVRHDRRTRTVGLAIDDFHVGKNSHRIPGNWITGASQTVRIGKRKAPPPPILRPIAMPSNPLLLRVEPSYSGQQLRN